MLKVQEPISISSDLDLPAPEVYIDSSEVEAGKITTYFYIEDNLSNWSANPLVLNNISLFIYCNDILFTESLSSLVKRNTITNGKLYSNVTFYTDADNIEIRAYCGNKNIKGTEVLEKVLNLNKIVSSKSNEETYKFYNKNKDLRILSVQNKLESVEEQIFVPNIYNNLFVSYTTNKKALFAFVIDLEDYLNRNSKQYNILKKNKKYREVILNNSYILEDTIKFYKKNLSISNNDYKIINTANTLIKAQDGVDENKYIITSVDDNNEIHDRSRYALKVSFTIKNYANEYLGQSILKRLTDAKTFILNYKQQFEDIQGDKVIENKNYYIFENLYEQYINDIKSSIQNLSEIFSFYTNNDLEEYYSLFFNIFHPLSAKKTLFEKVLYNINLIEVYINNLLEKASMSDVQNTADQLFHIFEHEFSFTNIEGRKDYEIIDYDFNYRSGYEVISMENSSNRFEEDVKTLKIYTESQKNARKLYESDKYFANTSSELYNKINHLSISYIDIDGKSYDLLNNSLDEKVSNYSEIFIILDNLKKLNFNPQLLESYYFQILYENAYVKNISNPKNISPNNLQKTSLFDPNLATKQKFLEYIAGTGIVRLYYILNENSYIPVPSNIYQYQATLVTGSEYTGIFPVNQQVLDTPETKATLIGMYNTFFEDKIVFSGQNYEIWCTEEALLNDIYKSGLRIFNKYYIVEKKKSLPNVFEEIIEYSFEEELLKNIPTKYLNRDAEPFKILTSIEDL